MIAPMVDAKCAPAILGGYVIFAPLPYLIPSFYRVANPVIGSPPSLRYTPTVVKGFCNMKEKCRFTHNEQEALRLRKAIEDNNGVPPSISVFRGRASKVLFTYPLISDFSEIRDLPLFTHLSLCPRVCA